MELSTEEQNALSDAHNTCKQQNKRLRLTATAIEKNGIIEMKTEVGCE